MIQLTQQLRKHLSSQTQGMTMMMMTGTTSWLIQMIQKIQRQHNHLPQGLHQHHTSQGDHIILMKSMKCLLYPRKIVDWCMVQGL